MQQSGASRRLSSRWAQPAGRLRGVLVKRGTDEASVRFGAVRCVLGLHPSSQIPLSSRRPRSEAFGLGSIPAGTRFPSSAPRLQAPRSQSSGRERNVRAGCWIQMAHIISHTPSELSPIYTGYQINDNTSLMGRFTLVSRYCCYYVINFQYPHSKTKTADGRMRHSELRHDWLAATCQTFRFDVSIGRAV